MSIITIACVNESWEMGNSKDNDLLYHIRPDLLNFRDKTMGNICVYGRKTYESLKKPFDGRTNVIITSNPSYHIDENLKDEYNIIIENDLERVLNQYKFTGVQDRDLYICGGASVYAEGLHWSDYVLITIVHDRDHPKADVVFPKQEMSMFKEISREKHYDEETELFYSFINYERKEGN